MKKLELLNWVRFCFPLWLLDGSSLVHVTVVKTLFYGHNIFSIHYYVIKGIYLESADQAASYGTKFGQNEEIKMLRELHFKLYYKFEFPAKILVNAVYINPRSAIGRPISQTKSFLVTAHYHQATFFYCLKVCFELLPKMGMGTDHNYHF